MKRACVKDGGDHQLALALLGIGQEKAALVDLPDEIGLVPERIAALHQRD